MKRTSLSFDQTYEREMLRRGYLSLFWVAMSRKRAKERFTFSDLAARIRRGKSQVSRWFSAGDPNWELNTIADIAHSLGIRIEISAVDIATKEILTPAGPISSIVTTGEAKPASQTPEQTAGDGGLQAA
jgi:hypothetical protein